MAYEHHMNVNRLTENEAKAIVLSIRTALSFSEGMPLNYDTFHGMAYLNSNATKAFLEALETD